MNYNSLDNNWNAFTLVELMVSITISVLLLWGVFYFMSETILGISRSSAQSKFLKDFYGFTTIFDTGNLEVLHDYETGSFDVGILKSLDNQNWLLIWVVDKNTLRLSLTWSVNTYHDNALWYRSLSSSEIANINVDPNIVYNYNFFGDKLFTRFNMQDFQLLEYNSWSTVEMNLFISPSFDPNYVGQEWSSLPRDEIFKYSLVF